MKYSGAHTNFRKNRGALNFYTINMIGVKNVEDHSLVLANSGANSLKHFLGHTFSGQ